MKKLIPLFTLVAGLLIAGCSGHNAKALYHQQRGDRFFKAGQFDQAEIEYLHVLRSDAANAHAIGQLGLIYYDEGRLQQAAPYLYKAVQLDTNNVDLHAKLGFLYQTVGHVKEARAEAEFILDRCPTNADAPLLLAQTAQMDAQTAPAEKQLRQLAQSHDTAAIEVALGTLALENGHLDEADTALAFSPRSRLEPRESQVLRRISP
ncbi:MAG TPA: tetratricopeptide repeat protein [Verrucomicrobiae bacterium]|nr:tetratricopeptide repeat protein [Verrucomicrobiae bacterium]